MNDTEHPMEPEHDIAEHLSHIPHSSALGMRYLSGSEDNCELAIAYSEHLVGDPDTGVIHGGAITALLDNAAGMVARPKDMHRDARAHCFKRTKNVAFVRAVAFTDSAEEPIATCTATFMLGTRNVPFSNADQAQNT